jgi:hypothetical protein
MRARGCCWVLAALLCPAAARGGDHRADVSAAVSVAAKHDTAEDLLAKGAVGAAEDDSGATVGGRFAAFLALGGSTEPYRPTPWGVELSASVDPHPRRTNVSVGPRFTIPLGVKTDGHASSFLLLHALAGRRFSSADRARTAYTLGAAWDTYPWAGRTWGFRGQLDYVRTAGSEIDDGVRVSLGIVWRVHDRGQH